MRPLIILLFLAQAGCIIDNDQVRVDSFTPDTPGTFAESLTANGMCGAGYVIETRRFVQPGEGPFGNGGDIVYTGRCL
jgi:hypothetical protein